MYGTSTAQSSRYGLIDRQGDVREMLKAFRSIVFSCVNVRAKEVANRAKWLVRRQVDVDEYENLPVDHPLHLLLANPNPNFTPWYFKYLMVCNLDLAGNNYWWAAKDGLGVPRMLWPLPPDRMKIIPGNPSVDGKLIAAYKIDWGGGNEFTMPADDVVHLRYPNPTDPYFYGGSLLMRAAYEVDIAKFVLEYQREFFANDAMPATVVTFENEMSPEARRAFEDQWIARFRRKPGQLGVLEGKATIHPIQDEKEMHYLESDVRNAKRIQSVFGVPDSKIMISETVDARATLETMDYAFQKETIDPLLTMIDEQLTYDLAFPLFGEDIVVQHVSTIPKDIKLQMELDAARVDKIQTVNEIRKRDGLDPLPGGDSLIRTFRDIPMDQLGVTALEEAHSGVGGGGGTQSARPGKEKRIPETRKLTEELKDALWKAHSRMQMRWELRLTKVMRKYFRAIEADVLKNINAGKLLSKASTEDATRVSVMLFDVDQWLKTLKDVLDEQAVAIMQAAFDEFIDTYAIEGVIFAPTSAEVQAALHDMNAKTVTVPADLHEELFDQLIEGIRLGESQEQLAARVSKFFNDVIDYRSIRIARTVSNYAVNEGNRIAAVDSGLFNRKTWVTQRDDKVRDLHKDIDGVEVGIAQKFHLMNGDDLDVPGDAKAKFGESVINCRCLAFFSKARVEQSLPESQPDRGARSGKVELMQPITVNVTPAPIEVNVTMPQGSKVTRVTRDAKGQIDTVIKE